MSRYTAEALALHLNIPLALAALLLAACATPPDPELCRIARADVAAGESMVADLYGTTTDHVTWCVRHVRVRLAEGLPVRRMPRERTSRAALAKAQGAQP